MGRLHREEEIVQFNKLKTIAAAALSVAMLFSRRGLRHLRQGG